MLAPVGTGFFYCRKSVLGVLDPPNVGYHSVDSTEDHMHYMLEYRQNAGRFEEALANFTGIWGLDAAVRIQLALTPKRIESHILELTGYAGAALQRKGWQIVSSRAQGEASGNLSFKHAGYDAQEIAVRLRNAGVDLAVRGGNLRISPTYYNDTSEIDRLVEAPAVLTAARRRTYQSERNVMTMLHTMRRLALGLGVSALVAVSSGVHAAGAPKKGGTLRYGTVSEIVSLDPHVYGGNAWKVLIEALYSPLVGYDKTGAVVPRLAQSWEQPDARSIVFHLRAGAKFHDGTPVTADDVKFSLDRILDPAAGATLRSNLQGATVTVVDAATVKVEKPSPDATLLAVLAMPEAAIVSRKWKAAPI